MEKLAIQERNAPQLNPKHANNVELLGLSLSIFIDDLLYIRKKKSGQKAKLALTKNYGCPEIMISGRISGHDLSGNVGD